MCGQYSIFGVSPVSLCVVQPQVDEIYVMEGGRVQQRGTYADLVSKAFDFGALLQQVAALVALYQLHIPNGWFAARRSCFQAERG